MSIFQGDFLGFTYDNIHSSTLGITRVSDGSRYTETLFPTIQDKSSIMTGSDGSLYFGSNYTQRQFQLQIAFDDMTEAQLRQLKQIFGDKNLHSLIFDELPYKKYKVKITGSPQLKYLAFNDTEVIDYTNENRDGIEGYYYNNNFYSDEEHLNEITPINGKFYIDLHSNRPYDYYEYKNSSFKYMGSWRILYRPQENLLTSNRRYKGEGTLNFIAYSSFARSVHKFLNSYTNLNKAEWAKSSGMRISSTINSSNEIDGYTVDAPDYTNHRIDIYNPGDFPTDFILRVKTEVSGRFSLNGKSLTLGNFLLGDDYGYQINTALHLIQGIDDQNKVTGTIYNRYITDGDFFKIPITNNPLRLKFPEGISQDEIEIDYDYLYY